MTPKGAHFSPCRLYRYSLWRSWAGLFGTGKGFAMFIGLNPSTADETQDDPTIRRCIGYAKAWGYEGLMMTNLFGWRATNPADMLAQEDPVGPENDRHLVELAAGAGIVIAAWGAHGAHLDRGTQVRQLLPRQLYYLRMTAGGQPGHPLYLPKDCAPQEWR